jgi:pilus assembly protein CpaB
VLISEAQWARIKWYRDCNMQGMGSFSMNRRSSVILLTAFAVAGVSTLTVSRLVAGRLTSGNHTRGSVVVAAAANIKVGAILAAKDLKTVEIVGAPLEGAIQDAKNAIGRGVLSDIYVGEPVLERRLAPVGGGGGLAATIPHGMRVCAVKVDEVVGVSGFVTPGMRVDVLISGVPPGGAAAASDGSQVRTLLQNIEVKSAGTDIEEDGQGKPQQVQVVNLLVTPDQAESLSLASSQTRIQLVLRNPLDTEIARVNGNTMGHLFTGGVAKAPQGIVRREPKKASQDSYTVEVLNGSKGSTKITVAGARQ